MVLLRINITVIIKKIEGEYIYGQNTECQYMKTYDYGKRIYYCDHANRTDDMGKLGVDELPEGSHEWCPLREK